jgi:hypothetical protein
MNIDQPQAFSHQVVSFQEIHGFIVIGLKGGWKGAQ